MTADTTTTPTLTAWLLEQVESDEAVARAAQNEGKYPHFGDMAAEETLEMALSEGCDPAGVAHFRRHDPARVLAQCAAFRAIIGLHPEIMTICQECANESYPCRTLRALATIFRDRPGYQEVWS